MSRLKELIKGRKIVALDTETYGSLKGKHKTVWDPSIRLAYISYWTEDGRGDVVKYEGDGAKKVVDLVEEFFSKDYCVVFWNAPFDLTIFGKEDLRPNGCLIQDAMVLAQTVHPTEHEFGLKHFSKKFLKVPYLEEDALRQYRQRHKCDFGSVPIDVMYPYALADAQYTYELYYLMIRKLDQLKMWETWELETKLADPIMSMIRKGIRVDPIRCADLEIAAKDELQRTKKSIVKESGIPDFNVNSPRQIINILWPGGKGVQRRTATGNPSTDNLSLLLDGRQIAVDIQKFRQYNKAISTYYAALEALPQEGILRCNIKQNQAITGRMSASGPNLQNQPRPGSSPLGRIRECYVAHSKDDFLLMIDFDQIELRLAAHFGQETHMLEAIRNGDDLHTVTRDRMFNLEGLSDEDRKSRRYLAKRLNFATLYGTGPAKFANTTLEDSGGTVRLDVREASEYIRTWWNVHPGITELRNRVLSEVSRTGGIRTAFGRFIPVLAGKDHAALNYLIQGSAADVIKRAIVRVHRFLKKNRYSTRMLVPVHDEIIFNVPRQEKFLCQKLRSLMEDRTNFDVPLTCSAEAGLRWGSKKPIKT